MGEQSREGERPSNFFTFFQLDFLYQTNLIPISYQSSTNGHLLSDLKKLKENLKKYLYAIRNYK